MACVDGKRSVFRQLTSSQSRKHSDLLPWRRCGVSSGRVQEGLGLYVSLSRGDDAYILRLLCLKEQLIVNDGILDSEIVQCATVGGDNGYQVLGERALAAPRLTEGEDDVGLWRTAEGHGLIRVLQRREKAVIVVEDSRSFFFGQCPGVSDRRRAMVDHSSTECRCIDAAVFNLSGVKGH